jgi:hypothetical protein
MLAIHRSVKRVGFTMTKNGHEATSTTMHCACAPDQSDAIRGTKHGRSCIIVWSIVVDCGRRTIRSIGSLLVRCVFMVKRRESDWVVYCSPLLLELFNEATHKQPKNSSSVCH